MKKLISILVLYLLTSALLTSQEYAGSSVLSTGTWHRVKIVNEGIYRIDFNDLSSLGLEAGSEIALYSNNYGLLSFYNDDPRPDDLVKTAIYIERGQDGIFNEGDYILFYGNSTHRWKYDYNEKEYFFQRHHYSDTAIYFIKLNELPLEISTRPEPGTANNTSEYSDYLFIHENEEKNIIKSGREWYEPLPPGLDYHIEHDLDSYALEEGTGLNYRISVLGRSDDESVIRLNDGGKVISSIMIPAVNIYNSSGIYANLVTESGEVDPVSSNPDLCVTFHNNGNITALAWLDYLVLQTRIENNYVPSYHEHFIIRDKSSIQEGKITRFKLKSAIENIKIWDISQALNIINIPAVYSDGEYSFVSATDSLKKFIAFSTENVMRPFIEAEPVVNQDLHKPAKYDMIIISHPLFFDYASELADIHSSHDSYQCLIVSPGEIYNEFSGGVPDISAIRNFIRMVYTRNKTGERPLKHLLLFGDGSYENKTFPPDNPNFIPTYQTPNSNVKIQSFTSDDYYGLLDSGEGEYTGYLDIGIGRLPVSDTLQARAIINKIKDYLSTDNLGPWRNIIAMVADDEDNNIHMNDSENIAELIESKAPAINIEKIYLDAYQQVTTISGQSYPDAARAINDRINKGCLIFNYAGHGNELGLAHERVVSIENINSWSNKGKYPAFVTATCEFSRFEDIQIHQGTGEITQKSSAGELVLLNPEGGAIALFSTTRIVFASANYNLASKLYENAFMKDTNGMGLTMGEIMRQAKINTSGENKRNFTLLGDPALRLAWPWHGRVVTDSINGINITAFNDTIMGLSELTIAGHIEDNSGSLVESYNGYLYPGLYDKKHELKTLANDGGQPFNYMAWDRILFRGKAEVVKGRFRFSIFIPREIDYSFGKGKISYFATDNISDQAGYYNDLIIGGLKSSSLTDTTGPLIRLFLNDTLFRNGGITDTDPVLLALISDPSSINTSGMGIGHDIVAVIDEESNSSVILNNYYENDLGTYKSGKITYPLTDMDRGGHTISLKAWDNFNNSSTASLVFIVRDDKGIVMNKLINYPNPFINSTRISVEHNRPDEIIEVTINIYNRNGGLVRTIKTTDSEGGYMIKPVIWDGRDNKGARVASGVYIYTVRFKTGKNECALKSGRMIIL
ncbi:MAG TPA: hypothetical protein DEQ09_12310 [Bacteroidales bacterium]|nr:hypothetical protein [Bacteroidales bacterium]